MTDEAQQGTTLMGLHELGELEDPSEEAQREELAQRVHGEQPQDPMDLTGSTEAVVRAGLGAIQSTLAAKRTEREALNGDIRQLVAEEEVLVRAVAVFDRWHEKQQQEEEDTDAGDE